MSPHKPGVSLDLRPYQKAAIDSLEAAWSGARRPTQKKEGAVNRPAVVLPTGTGKTVIFSALGARAHAAGGRALFLVHRDELADQTAEKLRMSAPGAWVGIVKAERNDTEADLVVASVQTLARESRRRDIGRRGLLLGVADEAHHAASPTWRRVMEHFGAFNGLVQWSGFTATMTRADKKQLGQVWEEVVYSKPLKYFIENGYLVEPYAIQVRVKDLDLQAVKASRGDLQAGDLGDALRKANVPAEAAQALLEHAEGRRTAAFWPTVDTALEFQEECLKLGIPCDVVTGETPKAERLAAYARLQERPGVIATAMVLTEGWDAPWCDCVLIARATKSRGLFAQMVGRGLRPWAVGGKKDCLVLDVAGATDHNDLATLAELIDGEPEEEKPKKPRKPADVDPDELEPEPELWRPDGELVSQRVDLFGDSDTLWLQTEDRGWWFIPVDGAFYFLYPQATGHYAVGRATSGAVRKVERLDKDLSLEWAMAWAERYAKDEDAADIFGGARLASRRARWRQGQARATPQQVRMASGFGIPVEAAQDMTKRELSDLINIRLATRVLAKVF